MHPPDPAIDWSVLARSIDELVVSAIDDDRRRRRITPAEIAAGFSQLARLRRGNEPDYEQRGLATAYAFAYLPQRVATAAAALTAHGATRAGMRVLDIGSGTDAAYSALEVLGVADCEVWAIEPSSEMRSFLRPSQEWSNTRYSIGGSMEDVLAHRVAAGRRFDLVTLSATLPYGWAPRPRAALAQWGLDIRERLTENGLVILIEPPAKAAVLQRAVEALRIAGIACETTPVDSLVGMGFLRRRAVRTSERLRTLAGELIASGNLTTDGELLVAPVEFSAARPDLIAVGRVGPLVRDVRLARRDESRSRMPRRTPTPTARPKSAREPAFAPRIIAAAITVAVLTGIALTWWRL